MDIDLTDLDNFSNGFPHHIFTLLRREAPVWFHPPTPHTPGGEGFWVLTRHADISAVSADAATFSSETGGQRDGGGTLIEDLPLGLAAGVLLNMMNEPRHRRFRALFTGSVSPSSLRALEAELRQRADAILDAVAERGACDFLVDVAAELPLQAIARLLGVPQEDRHRLFRWANATLDYDDRNLGGFSEKVAAANQEMFAYGGNLLAEKGRNPTDDLLSITATSKIEGDAGAPEPLSEIEQRMFFNLMIAAGSETTRNTLAVGLMALIEHPEQWQALERDRSLMPGAVEEVLRWASSTPYNRRTVTRDIEMRGQQLRAGDKVVLWWASANRDEDVFEDPFRFDIRRSPNPHLAFGHGSHFCLGANLARLEIRLVLDAILHRFAAIELAGPMEWTRSNKHTGVRHMPVRLLRRR